MGNAHSSDATLAVVEGPEAADYGAVRFFGEKITTSSNKQKLVSSDCSTLACMCFVEEYKDSEAYFFIGRWTNVTVPLEGALKCKGISYEHAERFPPDELKHGPLALVTLETPLLRSSPVTTSGHRNPSATSIRSGPAVHQ